MRSKEVAALSGVSVRTLRHYHQIGVLPEPRRDSNGYRHYELPDVARLLRIRRLTDLGVSLERVRDFLEDPEDDAGADLLDDLDNELRARIEHLHQQRARVAQLRSDRARPDLPPSVEMHAALPETGGNKALADVERDAALFLAQLVDDATYRSELQQFSENLGRSDPEGRIREVMERFQHLPADAGAEETEAVADEFVNVISPALAAFLQSPLGNQLSRLRIEDTPSTDHDPRLSRSQATVLRQIADRIDNGPDLQAQ